MRVRRVGRRRGKGGKKSFSRRTAVPRASGRAAVAGVPSLWGPSRRPRRAQPRGPATPRRGPRGAAGRCGGRERRLGGGRGDPQGPDAGAAGQPGTAFSSPTARAASALRVCAVPAVVWLGEDRAGSRLGGTEQRAAQAVPRFRGGLGLPSSPPP